MSSRSRPADDDILALVCRHERESYRISVDDFDDVTEEEAIP